MVLIACFGICHPDSRYNSGLKGDVAKRIPWSSVYRGPHALGRGRVWEGDQFARGFRIEEMSGSKHRRCSESITSDRCVAASWPPISETGEQMAGWQATPTETDNIIRSGILIYNKISRERPKLLSARLKTAYQALELI
jgi:hypothetical protein